jgi:hypothetical protein
MEQNTEGRETPNQHAIDDDWNGVMNQTLEQALQSERVQESFQQLHTINGAQPIQLTVGENNPVQAGRAHHINEPFEYHPSHNYRCQVRTNIYRGTARCSHTQFPVLPILVARSAEDQHLLKIGTITPPTNRNKTHRINWAPWVGIAAQKKDRQPLRIKYNPHSTHSRVMKSINRQNNLQYGTTHSKRNHYRG